MATTFTKQIQPKDGDWELTIGIGSKDPNDIILAQKYGDINLDLSGSYSDPLDQTFSFMIIEAKYENILLNKLPNASFIYLFDDAGVLSATRYRQSVIFSNAIQAKILDAMTKLRAMPQTDPINTTFTV